MTTEETEPMPSGTEDAGSPASLDELVRAATRLAMGTAGMAVSSATRWQRGSEGQGAGSAAAGSLASAAMGLGLAAERVVVRGAGAVGGTAASVTWGVVHASPLRGPIERLAERFRGEQRLSEEEASAALGAILDALGEALLSRVDLERLIDRIALDRVLARMDRRELADRIRTADLSVGG